MKKIKEIPIYLKLIDVFLVPFMFFIGGGKKENIQHTHGYHIKTFRDLKIDKNKCVKIEGTDNSKFKNTGRFLRHFGLFHFTIFGGWKDYVVIKNMKHIKNKFWFIGWTDTQFEKFNLHRLGIKNSKIKMLKGKKGYITYFFGIDILGKQVPLVKVGEGILGDKKFINVKLY